MLYTTLNEYFDNTKSEDYDSEVILDGIINLRWFNIHNQYKNKNNYNYYINKLKPILNTATTEQKNKLFNFVFSKTDILPHYYIIFIDDIFKNNHEEFKNKIDINDESKFINKYIITDYFSRYIDKNLLDKQLVEIFKKLKIVNYNIFSFVMTLGYIECIKYFFEQKILIKDDLIFKVIATSFKYYTYKYSYFSKSNYILTFTNLFKIIQEYHNISYDEMLALLINKIPIDISGFNLDDTFYKLNNIYKVYDIKKKTNDNILEILCETKPKLTEIKKIINKKKNSVKPTQKCLENLATYGTRSEVLSFILENSDCILTEDLLLRFENMKKDSISSIIKKKYIEQMIELKTNNKKEVKNVEK